MRDEQKTISQVRWIISMGDGSPVLLCEYGGRPVTVYGRQKPALLEHDLVSVHGLDPHEYEEGQVNVRGHQGPYAYTRQNNLIESVQLAREVRAMNDAFANSPDPLSDVRFAR